MKIISEDVLKILSDIEIQRNKQLIFENVYFSEIFNQLITYCFANVLTRKNIKLTGIEVKSKLNSQWKYFNDFNVKKSLVIISDIDTIEQYVKLTKIELSNIEQHLKHAHRIFSFDLTNEKNVGLIIIDKNINSISKVEDILTHELIHYFQWNLNKQIKHKLNYQINISETELVEISKCLNLSKDTVLKLIENCTDGTELETYINRIFYKLKDFSTENNIEFTRLFLSYICETFKNKNFNCFKSYFNNIQYKLAEYNFKLINLLKTDEIIYLILLGYFKQRL